MLEDQDLYVEKVRRSMRRAYAVEKMRKQANT